MREYLPVLGGGGGRGPAEGAVGVDGGGDVDDLGEGGVFAAGGAVGGGIEQEWCGVGHREAHLSGR